ncbi:Phage tail length tape-measure protein 1 [plant metagenome]|uniref:Phage tail length tape-measure protein 1 n=1 Tax=plant metagenome TaxID=1297885 RepID=A0A484RZ69_9ZZZZ
MATGGNLNVALKVLADVERARADLQRLRAELDGIGPAAAKVDGQGLDRLGTASSAAAKAVSDQAAATRTATTATTSQGSAARTTATATQQQATASTAAATAAQRQATAVNSAAKANVAGAMSAKQHAAAMRMLPAQMTDITVGLTTGQSPFMVLMQQGGQLKDMFGGIGPAAKAVGGVVLGLVNPLTVAAAAVAALGVAYYQGSAEGDAYVEAIVTTGNAAGVTKDQLATMASRIDGTVGTTRAAAQALAALAGSGQVGRANIEQLAETTVRMERSMGQAVETTVEQFAELGKSPVEASRKLNDRYGYLTASVYEQIKALVEEGKEREASELAQNTYAAAMDERTRKLEDNAGYIQRAWRGVRDVAAEAWDALLGIGREKTIDQQIEEAAAQVERLRAAAGSATYAETGGGAAVGNIRRQAAAPRALQNAEAELARLQQEKTAKAQAAADEAENQRVQKATIVASDAWQARAKTLRTWREQLADETTKIREQGKLLGKSDKEITDQITAATKKLTPKTPAKAKTDPVDTAYQQQLQQLQIARAQAAQNLANAQANVSATQEQATTRLEAWLAVNRNALKISDDRVGKLRAEAVEIDRLNAATKAETDTRARRERIVAGMADVDQALAQAQGRAAEANAAAVLERYRKLRADLVKEGDLSGLVKVDQLINVETARSQFGELQRQVERILGEQSRAEQSLSNQVTAGLTGELDARRQILETNSRTAQQIEVLLPRMRELAALTGNPDLADGVRDLELRVQGLRTEANELQQAFTSAFGDSLVTALTDLADGTADLGDAVRGFLSDLADGMAQWASQQIAMQAQSGLIGLFGGATSAAGAASAAAAGIDTAAATANTAALTASTAASTADVAATTAVTAATAALTPALVAATTAAGALATALTAAAGASTGSSASGLLGVVSSAASVAAATGGHIVGAGTGTSDSIAAWLSNGEFVARAAVVAQPGALGFLHDFNARGMAALQGWQRYADGGLVVAGASSGLPSSSSYQPAAINVGGARVDNRLQLNLVDDPARIADALTSPAGVEAMTVMLSRNPAKFRQILGV